MIMKIVWLEYRGGVEWERSGIYLFGILPLYIADHAPRGRRKA
jgi:hypothetical protein